MSPIRPPGLRCGDAGRESPAGGVDQPQVLVAGRADHEADRRVGDPAVDGRCEVEAQQVAVLQPVVVGESVQHGVVDRGADDLAERAGAERRVVVDVAGLGAGRRMRSCAIRSSSSRLTPTFAAAAVSAQHLGDEPAGRPHLLDLGGGPQLDHAISSSMSSPCVQFFTARPSANPQPPHSRARIRWSRDHPQGVLLVALPVRRGPACLAADRLGDLRPGQRVGASSGLLILCPILFVAMLAVGGIIVARRSVRETRAVSWYDVGLLAAWHASIVAFGCFIPGSPSWIAVARHPALAWRRSGSRCGSWSPRRGRACSRPSRPTNGPRSRSR